MVNRENPELCRYLLSIEREHVSDNTGKVPWLSSLGQESGCLTMISKPKRKLWWGPCTWFYPTTRLKIHFPTTIMHLMYLPVSSRDTWSCFQVFRCGRSKTKKYLRTHYSTMLTLQSIPLKGHFGSKALSFIEGVPFIEESMLVQWANFSVVAPY